MILRPSQKLAKKIKVTPLTVLPLDPNPFADWSAHLFTSERKQFVILTNTASLYSVVMPAKGVANDEGFLDWCMSCLGEYMAEDGQEFIFRRFIAPATGAVRLSKALNRSVTGSMNDLIFHARMWLAEGGLSPHDAASKLNEMPMSAITYRHPREAFKLLTVDQEPADSGDE